MMAERMNHEEAGRIVAFYKDSLSGYTSLETQHENSINLTTCKIELERTGIERPRASSEPARPARCATDGAIRAASEFDSRLDPLQFGKSRTCHRGTSHRGNGFRWADPFLNRPLAG